MTKGASAAPFKTKRPSLSRVGAYFLVVFFAAAVFLAGAAFFAAPALM